MTLVSDKEVSADIAAEWSSVRLQQARLQTYIVAGIHTGGRVISQVTDEIYALFLPFAYSVLEHVLEQARLEGSIACKSTMIGPLMDASRSSIQWSDFDAVDAGRKARNDLTHRRIVPTAAVTFLALNAIEAELVGWGVIEGPVHRSFQVSVG